MKRLIGVILFLLMSLMGCAQGEALFFSCGVSLSLPEGFEAWRLPQGNGRYGDSLLLAGEETAIEIWVDKGPVIACALYTQDEQAGLDILARVMPQISLHLPGVGESPSKKELQAAVAQGEPLAPYPGELPPAVTGRGLGKSAQLAVGGQRIVKKGSVSLRQGEGFTLVPEYSLLILSDYQGPRIAAQGIPALNVFLMGDSRIDAQRATSSDLKGIVESVAALSIIGGDASLGGAGALALGGDCDYGLYIAQAQGQKKAALQQLTLGGTIRLHSQGALWGIYAAGNAQRGQESRVLVTDSAQVMAAGKNGLFAYTELAMSGQAALCAQGEAAGVLLPGGASLSLVEAGVLEALSQQGTALRLPRPLNAASLTLRLGSSRESAQPVENLTWVGFDYDNGDMGAQTPCHYLCLSAPAAR